MIFFRMGYTNQYVGEYRHPLTGNPISPSQRMSFSRDLLMFFEVVERSGGTTRGVRLVYGDMM